MASMIRESSPPDTIFAQRPQILARVRGHEEFDAIDPLGGPLLRRQRFGGEADLEARAFHRQLGQQGFELPGEVNRDLTARPAERLCRGEIMVARACLFPLELDEAFVVVIELGQLLAQSVAP